MIRRRPTGQDIDLWNVNSSHRPSKKPIRSKVAVKDVNKVSRVQTVRVGEVGGGGSRERERELSEATHSAAEHG